MYYKPKQAGVPLNSVEKEIMNIRSECPYYGYRRIGVELRKRGLIVNHKKVCRLLRKLGVQTIYPKKITTRRDQSHKTFPYLLRTLVIERPNQVWQVDITYIKICSGFVYLIGLIDVFSRKIMSWKLATSCDTSSCLEVLNAALEHNIPEIINSDQGCQFTSDMWIHALQENNIGISMDGKGRWADNIYVERFWRTIKYELVYLYSFDSVQQTRLILEYYIHFYNQKRPHQSLNYHTPDIVFAKKIIPSKQQLFDSLKYSEAHMVS